MLRGGAVRILGRHTAPWPPPADGRHIPPPDNPAYTQVRRPRIRRSGGITRSMRLYTRAEGNT
ncbi:hypothetical protein GCM10010344_59830 [Streptomyces bluensis]|nr:hypothetical protein GCM10010344_59830 [Streptomyces bluensis]